MNHSDCPGAMADAFMNGVISIIVVAVMALFACRSVLGANPHTDIQYRVYTSNKTLPSGHPDYWLLYRVHRQFDPVFDFVSDIAKLRQAGHEIRVEEIGVSNVTPPTSVVFEFKA